MRNKILVLSDRRIKWANNTVKRILILLMTAIFILSVLAFCSEAERSLSAAELLDLGEKYLLELNYEQALVYFTRLIEVEPMNPRGYMGAAEAYVELDRIDDAIAILEQGLTAMPNNTEIQSILTDIDSTAAEPPVISETTTEPTIAETEPTTTEVIATTIATTAAPTTEPPTPEPTMAAAGLNGHYTRRRHHADAQDPVHERRNA